MKNSLHLPQIVLALSIAIMVVVAAGCDQLIPLTPRSTPETMPPLPTTSPVKGTYGGVLTVRTPKEIGTINPLSDDALVHNVSQLVFSGLMRLDAQLRPVPDIAESWSASPDEQTWTFKLRANVRWHDGTTFTGDDVIFTYRALLNGPLAQGPIGVVQADLQQVVDQIEIPDPYTLQIKLKRRFAPFLADLTTPVLPAHLLKTVPVAQLWRQAITVGTGPFKLLERKPGDALIVESFDQYYLGRPYLDRVAFITGGDEPAVAKSLEEGQLLLAEVGAATATTLRQSKAVQVLSYPDVTFYYVGFNLRPGHLFADKSLRQAWSYAIGKAALVREMLGERAEIASGDIPPYSWAFDQTPSLDGNPTKAKELLGAAGWQQIGADGIRVKDGQRLSIELAVRQDAPERIALAKAMAGELKAVGIEVRVVPSDFDSTMAASRRPPFDFAAMLMGWTMGIDPDDYYLFHSSQIPSPQQPSGYNYVGYHNETFDRLSMEARGTTDTRKRTDLYHQMQRILADDQPYYYLYSEKSYVVASRRLEGLPNPMSPSFWSSIAQWQLKRS